MSYFGGSGGMAGDPGFFDAFKGAIGGFISGGPLGAISGGIKGFRGRPTTDVFQPPPRQVPVTRVPGIVGVGQRAFPGGATGFETLAPAPARAGAWPTNKDGSPRRAKRDGTPWKRPTMNPTNPKALMRAARRADSFVRVARRVLKNTGWKISSKSSGKMTQAAWEKKAHHAK